MGTDSLSRKPNFLIVGAAKAGTTSLFDYLSQHPEIFLPELKESKYFTYTTDYAGPGSERLNKRVVKTEQDYLSLFSSVNKEMAIGEVSPDYLYYYDVAINRISALLGDVRIIIIIRNPVQSAFSAYMHKRRDLLEPLSFEEALKKEEERMAEGWEFLWFYKKMGLVSNAIKAYKESFSKVHILLFDELISDPSKSVRDIFRFLDVDNNFAPSLEAQNESGEPKNLKVQKLIRSQHPMKMLLKKYLPKWVRSGIRSKLQKNNLKKVAISESMKIELTDYYSDEVNQLEGLLNRDLSKWK